MTEKAATLGNSGNATVPTPGNGNRTQEGAAAPEEAVRIDRAY